MSRPAGPPPEGVGAGALVRRRPVAWRRVGDKVVLARPLDGTPVVLAPTAAFVWHALAGWTTSDQIGCGLAESYPGVDEARRSATLSQILTTLASDDLLEHA